VCIPVLSSMANYEEDCALSIPGLGYAIQNRAVPHLNLAMQTTTDLTNCRPLLAQAMP
jgi:hypothetical protein